MITHGVNVLIAFHLELSLMVMPTVCHAGILADFVVTWMQLPNYLIGQRSISVHAPIMELIVSKGAR